MKITLVENWRSLWRAWTVQLAALGVALPDVLQLVADHTDLLPWFSDADKSAIRLACLVAILFARHIQQKALAK